MKKILFIILILTLSSCSKRENQPLAVDGILDLSQGDFDINGSVDLKGKWGFYWNQLLFPEEINSNKQLQKYFIKVPNTWKGYEMNNQKLPRFGFGTYHLKIKTKERGHFYLYFKLPNAASVFWVNGKEICRYGKIGRTYEQEEVELGTEIVELHNDTGEIDLVIQVSNFNKFSSGLAYSISLGKRENVFSSRILAVALDVFLAACLFLISFYHFSFYLFRKKEKSSLLLSFFCIIYVFRIFSTSQQLFTEIEMLHWQIIFRIDFLTITLIIPLFIEYINSLYSKLMFPIINKSLYGISFLYMILILLLPVPYFTSFLIYYHMIIALTFVYLTYVLIRALINKYEGAILMIVAYSCYGSSAIFDVLVANEIIDSFFISPIAFLIFFLFLVLNLSHRFAKGYEQVEQFSGLLEKEVQLRTVELEKERNLLEEWQKGMEKELVFAKKIQEKLIPNSKIQPVSYISSLYKPMEKVGGDFIDFFNFRESEKIGIFISDVSGHGVPAALVTSMIKTSLLQAGIKRQDPAELLLYLNEILQNYTANNFITAMYGIYDPGDKHLQYSIAGHNPPILISENSIETLKVKKSLPLAIMPEEVLVKFNKKYLNYEIQLKDYEKLVFYTDGLTEAASLSNDEEYFEYTDMRKVLHENRHLPCDKFIEQLYKGLVNFRGSQEFDDDICVVCIDL